MHADIIQENNLTGHVHSNTSASKCTCTNCFWVLQVV